jgi:hypothetical protein
LAGATSGNRGIGSRLKPCEPNTSSSDSSGSLRMLSAASLGEMLNTGSGMGGNGALPGGGAGGNAAAGEGWSAGGCGAAAGCGAAGPPGAPGAPPTVAGARTTCLQCGQRTCLPSKSIPTPIRRPQKGQGNVCVWDDIGSDSGKSLTGRPLRVERLRSVCRKVYLTLSFSKHQNALAGTTQFQELVENLQPQCERITFVSRQPRCDRQQSERRR